MTTRKDNTQFLAEVRKATGVEALVPGESGPAAVRPVKARNVDFQFAGATGKILSFVEVAELAQNAPRPRRRRRPPPLRQFRCRPHGFHA